MMNIKKYGLGIGIVFKVYLASGFPFLATNSEGKNRIGMKEKIRKKPLIMKNRLS